MISNIDITNWKGHEKASLNFSKGVNFITGPNGIGKTSLLDAICFALLGTIEFLGSYKKLTYRNLIRNPEFDAEIRISLSINGNNYEIFRKLGASRKAGIYKMGKLVESRWDSVTERVLDLFNSSEGFLGRCVFLTEGDTYEYISNPPGNGLAQHVESILGIDRMENLLNSMNVLSNRYNIKSKELRSKQAQMSLADEKDIDLIRQYSVRIDALERDRTHILKDMKELNKELEELISNIMPLRNILNSIRNIVDEWSKISTQIDSETNLTEFLQDTMTLYQKNQIEASKKRDQLSIKKGEISAQINHQRAIRDILHAYPEVGIQQERKCPVCKRPLSEHLARQIDEECVNTMDQLQKKLNDVERNLVTSNNEIGANTKRLAILNKLELKIADLYTYNLPKISMKTIDQRIRELEVKSAGIKQKIEEYQYSSEKFKPEIMGLEIEKKQLRERTDPQKLMDLNKDLVNSSKIEFLSDIFTQSIEDSLTQQRNSMLAPLTQELSRLWSNYMNTEVKIELGSKFELNIIDPRFSRPFTFSQLSGGEKTALLILTHVLLCKYFSDSDFMLLDEPLEHLDSRNRWALINFLVQSCTRGFPDQLIITTIEEPYVREYLGSESVQVMKLG